MYLETFFLPMWVKYWISLCWYWDHSGNAVDMQVWDLSNSIIAVFSSSRVFHWKISGGKLRVLAVVNLSLGVSIPFITLEITYLQWLILSWKCRKRNLIWWSLSKSKKYFYGNISIKYKTQFQKSIWYNFILVQHFFFFF